MHCLIYSDITEYLKRKLVPSEIRKNVGRSLCRMISHSFRGYHYNIIRRRAQHLDKNTNYTKHRAESIMYVLPHLTRSLRQEKKSQVCFIEKRVYI